MTSSKHSPAEVQAREAAEQDQQLISRRQLIKAGWTLPLITAVAAPKDLFAAGSFTGPTPTPPPVPAPDKKVYGAGSGSTDDTREDSGYYPGDSLDSGSGGNGSGSGEAGGILPGGSPGNSAGGSSGSGDPRNPRLPYNPRYGSFSGQTSGSLTTRPEAPGESGIGTTLGWRPDSGNAGGGGSTS